jgi:AraC-like DNA-binding protein
LHRLASCCVEFHDASAGALRLERISPGDVAISTPAVRRLRHPPRQELQRHVHPRAFAAVVLSGGYIEAGDTGRHRMAAGDVLLHQAFEGHLDRFDARGAEVLMFDLAEHSERCVVGQIGDPDALVRLAERDPHAALARLLANLEVNPQEPRDWPDLLARDLRADPTLSLETWADAQGLHPGSISRGFRQVFGLTPAAYRVAQRTVCAIRAISASTEALGCVAHDCGFADQAHMNRSVRRLAGITPGALRRPRALLRSRMALGASSPG